jgi:hypothetical protein
MGTKYNERKKLKVGRGKRKEGRKEALPPYYQYSDVC